MPTFHEVKRKNPDFTQDVLNAILAGMVGGIGSGGAEMTYVAKENAYNNARYPEGELASETDVSDTQIGELDCSLTITAGTDHAAAFEFGTSPHFVPAGVADHRIVEGLYPHIKPVYPQRDYDLPDEKSGIQGYIAWGNKHDFMGAAFNATKDYTITEVRNGIQDNLEGEAI